MEKKLKSTADLLRSLPELVAAQVIDAPTAERLRTCCEPPAVLPAKTRLLTFCAILAAVMAGGGLTMIIAHNWDMLSPDFRMACGFVPLLASLFFGGWVLYRRKSAVWREPVAPFIAAALTGTIALVSQVYHSNGTLDQLLFVVLAFSVALMFLFDSLALATLFAVGIWPMFFAGPYWGRGDDLLYVLKLLTAAGGIGYLLLRLRHTEKGTFIQVLIVNAILAVTSIAISRDDVECAAFLPPAVCGCLLWSLGTSFEKNRRNILRWFGILTLTVTTVVGCFSGDWRIEIRNQWVPALVTIILLAFLLLHALFRRRSPETLLPLGVPFAVILGGLLAETVNPNWIMYTLMIGYGVILLGYGARKGRMGEMNLGMGILSLYILLRFFQAKEDFLLNGFIFIVSGAVLCVGCCAIHRYFREESRKEAEQ